jgi:hypothetical protein
MSDGKGQVWEVDAADLKVFSLDQTLSDPATIAVFNRALDTVGLDQDAAGKSARELVELLDGYANELAEDRRGIKVYEDGLRELGYDAVVHNGNTRNGVKHEAHNAFMLLNEDKVKPVGFYEANAKVRKQVNPESLENVKVERSMRNRMDIDADALEASLAKADSFTNEPTAFEKNLDDMVEQQMEEFKALEQQGLMDADDLKAYKELQEFDKKANLEDVLLKAVIHCVGG